LRLALALVVVVACKPSGSATEASASAQPAPTASNAPFDGGVHAVGATIESVVRAWNAAINAHDADKVGALYSDEIELYGRVLARDKAVALKRGAFAGHLRDDIADIVVDESGRASFHKTSTLRSGKVIDVQGYLDVHDGKITSEGDTTTDKNLTRARSVSCEAAVMALVNATPEARKAMKDIDDGAKAMHDVIVGRAEMAMPPEKAGGAWDVAICENFPDRMPCYHHFAVTPAAGTVTYSLYGDDKRISIDPALLAKARSACP
jgi:hypothetical protein